jgi:prepilin-type N-terminal cleavage/methylation domain-containing protein
MDRSPKGMKLLYRSREAGFTMIEMIVSMLIFGLIISGIYAFITMTNRSYWTNYANAVTQQDTRLALTRMEEDVYDAESPDGLTTAVVTSYAAPYDYLDVYADVNENGVPDRVVYRVSNGGPLQVAIDPPGTQTVYPFTSYTTDSLIPATWFATLIPICTVGSLATYVFTVSPAPATLYSAYTVQVSMQSSSPGLHVTTLSVDDRFTVRGGGNAP